MENSCWQRQREKYKKNVIRIGLIELEVTYVIAIVIIMAF
jgi:hypothetical protein